MSIPGEDHDSLCEKDVAHSNDLHDSGGITVHCRDCFDAGDVFLDRFEEEEDPHDEVEVL